MKKIITILLLVLAFTSFSQVSRNRLKDPSYSWISRQVPINKLLDSTFKSFWNINDDGTPLTATSASSLFVPYSGSLYSLNLGANSFSNTSSINTNTVLLKPNGSNSPYIELQTAPGIVFAPISSTYGVQLFSGTQGAFSWYAKTPAGYFYTRLSTATNTANLIVSMPSANGQLALTSDITTATASAVPNTRSITVNGVGYDLSADRSYSTNPLFVNVASNYTLNPWDYALVDASANSVSITLPASPANNARASFKLLKQSGSFALTLFAGGTNSINVPGGVTSFSYALVNQGYQCQYNAGSSTWVLTALDFPVSSILTPTMAAANYWSLAGNSPTTNTNFIGTNNNTSYRIGTNNAIRFKIDSVGVIRTYSTSATSTVEGSSWWDGGLYGYTYYQNNANGGAFRYSNGPNNYLALYQDQSQTNWLYTKLGNNIVLSVDGANNQAYQVDQRSHSWGITTQTASTAGYTSQFRLTGGNNINQAASVEQNIFIVGGTTTGYATGNLATWRVCRFGQGVIKFAGTSTLTEGSSLSIDGAVSANTNAFITNSSGLSIGMTAPIALTNSVQNAYAISAQAPTGAQNNYAARFMGGNVGVGTASPAVALDVAGSINSNSVITTPSLTIGNSAQTNSLVNFRLVKNTGTVEIGERATGFSALWLGAPASNPTNYILTHDASSNTILNSMSGGTAINFSIGSSIWAQIAANLMTLGNGQTSFNISCPSTNGTQLGTSTSQKLGAYGTTPIVQPSATTDLGVVLSSLGWRAAGTAWPLTTTGNVSFGNVSLPHIIGTKAIASFTNGTGAGTTPTVVTTGCTDLSGTITLTVGASPAGSNAVILTGTFGTAYTSGTAPNIIWSARNPAATALNGTSNIYFDATNSTFFITSGSLGLTAGSVYKWSYQITQ